MMKNNNVGKNKKFNKGNKKPSRPKNEMYDVLLKTPYLGNRGLEVPAAQVEAAFDHLMNNKIFDILSVPVQIAKSTLFGDPERKGYINVGYLKEIDYATDTVCVCVYGGYVEKIEAITSDEYGLAVQPRIITDRDGDFVTFTAFDMIIPESADLEDVIDE